MDAKINEQVKNKKQDNLITAEIRYKMTAKGMMITEYYGADSCVVLPDEIEGETVTARYGWRCIDGLSSGRSGDIFP